MASTDDRSADLYAVIILFLALTWTTFLMRIYVRAKILKSVGIDDVLTAITMVRTYRSLLVLSSNLFGHSS